jgi:hypothetical protein
MILLTDIYEYQQIRFLLTAEPAGILENAELSLVYNQEIMQAVELWVRRQNDNVKGRIRIFEAKNKDTSSESFQQDLVSQVNDMEDINDYIDAWILRRRNEK